MIKQSVRRLVATAALIVLMASGVAHAQTPVLTPSTLTVTPGTSVSAASLEHRATSTR